VEGDLKNKLAELIESHRKKELLMGRLILKESIRMIEEAPTVILVYRKDMFLKGIREKAGRRIHGFVRLWETQSVASAIQNMLLAFHSMDVGTRWLGAPLIYTKKINKLLGVEDELMAIVSVGYPEEVSSAKRKPLSQVISFKK